MHTVRKARHYRLRNAASFSFLIGATLCSFCSFAAVAEIYPVNGVWTAIGPEFPINRQEACVSLKTFGTEAVSRKSIPELIIFTKDKRYDVKGDDQNETTIKSINAADGGFWITESLSKRSRWMIFKRKTKYFLKIVDPLTIEIWDRTTLTRYAKCGSQKPPI
jgi:hypothetical protein